MKNFSTKKQIDSYLRNLDNNGYKFDDFNSDALESEFIPNLGNTGYKGREKLKSERAIPDHEKRAIAIRKIKKDTGKCAICDLTPDNTETLVLDHNHTSKVIRGVLCQNCNHGLGKFKDDVVLFKKAIKYLQTEPEERINYYNLKPMEKIND